MKFISVERVHEGYKLPDSWVSFGFLTYGFPKMKWGIYLSVIIPPATYENWHDYSSYCMASGKRIRRFSFRINKKLSWSFTQWKHEIEKSGIPHES